MKWACPMTPRLGFILFRFPLLPVRVGPGTAQTSLICNLTVEKPFGPLGEKSLTGGAGVEGK